MQKKHRPDSKKREFFSKILEKNSPYFHGQAMPGRDLSELVSPRYKSLKMSAVLVIFGSKNGFDFQNVNSLSLLYTQRSSSLRHHPGQISFPGGSVDAHKEHTEIKEADFYQTALRECEEEVGIQKNEITVLGHLPPLYTVSSNFIIVPVLGFLNKPNKEIKVILQKNEVEDVFWVSIEELLQIEKSEVYERGELKLKMPVYEVGEKKIWGATAVISKNLLDRFQN